MASNTAFEDYVGHSLGELAATRFDTLFQRRGHPERLSETGPSPFAGLVPAEFSASRSGVAGGPIVDVETRPVRVRRSRSLVTLVTLRERGTPAHGSDNDALMRIAAQVARFAGWYFDIPSERIVWGDGVYDLLKMHGEVPAGSAVLEMFEPHDRASVVAAFEACMRDGVPIDLHARMRDAVGTLLHVRLVGEAERDSTGTVVRINGAFHDISMVVSHKAEQRAMAERLRRTLDQMRDAISFIDRDWKFTFSNQYALELAGVSDAEIRQLTLWDLFPAATESEFGAIYRRAMYDGISGSARKYVEPWACWFDVVAHPTAEGIAIIVRDVTEDQEARVKLDEYTAKVASQAALLDAARDAIMVRSLDGVISYWNKGAESIYGWSAAEATGRNVRELIYDDPKRFDEATELLRDEGYWTGEIEQRRSDGSVVIADCRWQLVRDDDGTPVAVFAVTSDITDYKREQEQRLRAQRLESLGTLAGGIAHDLNNVMTPILLATQLLHQDESDPRRRELITLVNGVAKRGASMINQVLSFARGSKGKREHVEIRRLLDELSTVCRETFPDEIELDFATCPRSLAVQGDSTELFQVLVNLANNARDSMPQGGRLSVSVRAVGSEVVVAVTDTGSGMSEEVRSRIFEPFFTTKSPDIGTGLGLATSIAIVKSHGGTMNVVSAPQRGTTVELALPVADAQPASPSDDHAPRPSVVSGRGRRVLVVDDEPSIRDLLSQTLEREGYRVETANSSEAALVLADPGHAVDVLVTDVVMPLVSGEELARVAAERPHPVAVVFMSGIGLSVEAQAALERHRAHFLPKPFTSTALVETLEASWSSACSDRMHNR
ncbi:PAS domain S-box protein [Leifsonia sp. NPDC058248]|uniref:PAS domain-containing hybrid sensor histidine kinase/response regulator n=1 Tax=Leifsonia sp. NPDC058248 TaxID=3346402 RepID=UPI0036DEED6D